MNISIENLTKIYKNGNQALKDINLEIENGMFGLLGPNGAGKSSLMRILVTLMKPTSGTIKVNDLDLMKHRNIETMSGVSVIGASCFLPGKIQITKAWVILQIKDRIRR